MNEKYILLEEFPDHVHVNLNIPNNPIFLKLNIKDWFYSLKKYKTMDTL